MTTLRSQLAALSVVVALVAMTCGPVFAQETHLTCVAEQHDCGKTARVSKCCCGDQAPARTDSTPGQPRVEVRADMTATPALQKASPTSTRPTAIRVQTSPPRLCLLDLSTLFATFLI